MNAEVRSYFEVVPLQSIDGQRTAAGSGLSAKVVSDAATMSSLSNEWEELVSSTAATVFQTFEWQITWWKHFGSGPENHLYVILFRKEARLVGIAPFFIQSNSLLHFNVFRRLLFLGSGLRSYRSPILSLEKQGPSDYLDLIVAPDFEDEVCRSLLDLLRRETFLWDEIELQNVPGNGIVSNYLLPMCDQRDFFVTKEHEDSCPVVALPGTTDEFLASMRRSVRRNLRYVQRGFLESAEYSVEDSAKTGNTDGAMQTLAELHQKRWNAIGYPGLFSDKRFGAFLQEIARHFRAKDRLWLRVLRREKKTVAVHLCYKFRDRIYSYASGFDRDSESGSGAGAALVFQCIMDSINSGLRVLDMGRGTEGYKFQFTNTMDENFRISLVPRASGKTGTRHQVHRLYSTGTTLMSRVNCELTIARIIAREKGTLKGLTGYLMHIARRLYEKQGGDSSNNGREGTRPGLLARLFGSGNRHSKEIGESGSDSSSVLHRAADREQKPA